MWPLLFVAAAVAQSYAPQPCASHRGLALDLARDGLSSLVPEGPEHRLSAASSVLAPPGSKKPTGNEGDQEVRDRALDGWSCTYGAPRLTDGDTGTGWAEGVEGLGKGEVVVVPLPGKGPLQIWAGHGNSASLFAKNGRPTVIEVALLGQGWRPASPATVHRELPLLGSRTVELRDHNGWQPLPLPRWRKPAGYAPELPEGYPEHKQVPTFLALRLVQANAGTESEDVVISEVRLRPR
jgi:hypothetical protein